MMYIDTCVAAKLYLPEPGSDAVQRLASKEDRLISSELLITEMASLLCRKAREKHIDRHEQQEVWDLFVGHVTAGLWTLYPLGNLELRAAADVIRECQDSVPLRTLDAIHLSVCRTYQIFPLCTTDQVMLRAAKVLGIRVQKIETL